MGMIKGSTAVIDVLLILRADGNDATGLTPTARLKGDGGAWANATNAMVEGENGSYSLALTGTETNVDHLAVKVTATGAITQLVNVYTVDVEQYKADISNLDVAVSTRMPTTHINATAGKVDGVATTDTATAVTNPVTTDTASRDASKADVSALATQASLDNVPKRGDGDSYRQLRNGAGAIVQQIRETITATEQP